MTGVPGRVAAVAAVAVAAVLLAGTAGPAAGQSVAAGPVPGPVGLSVGNESRIAVIRAERWLENHGGIPSPAAAPEAAGGEELERLMPLLQGDWSAAGGEENVFEAWGRLAAGLARKGEAWVFLADGSQVPWANAILHGLVASQRPDDRGGGWWAAEEGADPDGEDALRSTRAAYGTLLFLLGGGGN